MSAKHVLTFTLQQLDEDGETLARRQFSVEDDDITAGELRAGYLIDTSQATISVPVTQPRQLLLRNTSASQKITVVWTPYGGAEVTINKLGPGGTIALWDPTAAATGIGVSSLKLTGDVAGATYELFIGG